MIEQWTIGYTQAELDTAQTQYGLVFPPDLIELLLEKRPVQGYDWRNDDERIREMLEWPFKMLRFDVEENDLWLQTWGERPPFAEQRFTVLQELVDQAPRLIPLYSHRFIPETPCEHGNPVFSMYGFDTIYYGSNLAEYFSNEFGDRYEIGPIRRVPFWSDLVESN